MNRRSVRAVLAGATALMAAAAAGCQLPALVVRGVMPPEDIEAVFVPPNEPTVVFIDDPSGRMPSLQVMDLICDRIGRQLREAEAIGVFIPPNLLTEVRLNEREFGAWPIDKVGKRVGARQVIYIAVEAFDLGQAGDSAKPTASVRIKVVDVASGRRLFPQQDPTGYALTSALFYKTLDAGDRGAGQMMERRLADRLAEDVAKLFYKHAPRPVGSDFPD